VELFASSPWSAFISVDLGGAKKFQVETSCFDRSWGSLTTVVDVGFVSSLSASSVGILFHLLYSWNFSLEVMVVLAVFLSAVLS
jgi:hypothetical protein